MKNAIIIIVCLIIGGGIGFYFYNQSREPAWKNAQKEYLDLFLKRQSAGGADEFFCRPSDATTLYAVKSWAIVDAPFTSENESKFTLRIESSTKAGIQIEKLWSLEINKSGSDYCVASFQQKQ